MFGSARLVNLDLDLGSGSINVRMSKLQVAASSKVESKGERGRRHAGARQGGFENKNWMYIQLSAHRAI
jgi:hypothetical protein